MLAVLCRNWSITSTIENCVPKFREKVCRNAENCLFLKNQPVNRNVWDENEKERELQDLGIRFVERLPYFPEIPENTIPLVTEDFQNFKPKFWMHVKRSQAPAPFSGSSLIYLSLSFC